MVTAPRGIYPWERALGWNHSISTTTYCQPNAASLAAMLSALALTSSSFTVGPNESQLFQPMGGVGANIVSAAVAEPNAQRARKLYKTKRKGRFIQESFAFGVSRLNKSKAVLSALCDGQGKDLGDAAGTERLHFALLVHHLAHFLPLGNTKGMLPAFEREDLHRGRLREPEQRIGGRRLKRWLRARVLPH